MNNNKKCVVSVTVLALCACGGGDGGGGGNGGSNSPAPQTTTLVLNAGSAVPAATQTFANAQLIDLTTELLISAAVQLQLNQLRTIELECEAGGGVDLRYTDGDADSRVSPGDEVAIVYADCGGIAGALTLALTAVAQRGLTFDALVGAATLDLVLTDGADQFVLSGTQTVDFSIDMDVLRWRSSAASFTTTAQGRTTRARDAVVSKTIDAEASEYALNLSASLEATAGLFSASTPTDLSGTFGGYPNTGAMMLLGRDSRAEFRANDDDNVEERFARLRIDEDGDGVFGVDSLIEWRLLGADSLFGVEEDEPSGGSPGQPPPAPPDLSGRRIDLGSEGHEAVLDSTRSRLYVSVPARNEVAVLDLDTLHVLQRVYAGPRPMGIALASDGISLYVAQNAGGAIGVLDLASQSLGQIVVAPTMTSSLTFDVIEARPGVLFATGSPGSSGFARVVRVDRGAGDAVTAAAGGRIIRADPELVASADGARLFVGEGFSPNSLYGLDVTDPDAPIVLEDVHGSIGGTDRMSLSPDGTRIYLRTGQVLATQSFSEIGHIGAGVPFALDNGEEVAVAAQDGAIAIYDAATFELIDRLTTDCELPGSPERLLALPQSGQWLMLSGQRLCAIDLFDPTNPPGLPGSGGAPGPVEMRTVVARQVVLEEAGFDLELDTLRDQVFVSMPAANAVVALGAGDLAQVRRYAVPQEPRGIDLGPTSEELAIAFNASGSVGFLDPDSGALDTTNLTPLLGDRRGHDVAYVGDDAVFVTASPSSNGLAYVVQTTRAAPADGRRVAGGNIIRAEPELAAAADGNTLFVGEGFSPNSLYRLDLTQPDAPIVAEDVHGTVSGTDRLGLNADASLLALSSGQIVRTSDFSQAGLVGPGVARFSADGALVVVAANGGTLHAYDAGTLQERFVVESDCAIGVPQRLEELPSQQAWAVLGQEVLCVIPTAAQAPVAAQAKTTATTERYRCDGDCLVRRYVVPTVRAPMRLATEPRR